MLLVMVIEIGPKKSGEVQNRPPRFLKREQGEGWQRVV